MPTNTATSAASTVPTDSKSAAAPTVAVDNNATEFERARELLVDNDDAKYLQGLDLFLKLAENKYEPAQRFAATAKQWRAMHATPTDSKAQTAQPDSKGTSQPQAKDQKSAAAAAKTVSVYNDYYVSRLAAATDCVMEYTEYFKDYVLHILAEANYLLYYGTTVQDARQAVHLFEQFAAVKRYSYDAQHGIAKHEENQMRAELAYAMVYVRGEKTPRDLEYAAKLVSRNFQLYGARDTSWAYYPQATNRFIDNYVSELRAIFASDKDVICFLNCCLKLQTSNPQQFREQLTTLQFKTIEQAPIPQPWQYAAAKPVFAFTKTIKFEAIKLPTEEVDLPQRLKPCEIAAKGDYMIDLPIMIKQYLMKAAQHNWSDADKLMIIETLSDQCHGTDGYTSHLSNHSRCGNYQSVAYYENQITWLSQLVYHLQAHWNVTVKSGRRPLDGFYNYEYVLDLMLQINPDLLLKAAANKAAQHSNHYRLDPKFLTLLLELNIDELVTGKKASTAKEFPIAAGSAAAIALPGTATNTAAPPAAASAKDAKSQPPKPGGPA